MKTYTEQEQKINLAKLAFALRTMPPPAVQFDMENWGAFMSENPNDLKEIENGYCGSVGCALGVATYVIEPRERVREGYMPFELWDAFGERIFGIPDSVCAWNWIFSAWWAEVDNTPEGAAARIEWYLAHGVPDNASAQEYGEAPLCYKEGK